MGPAARDALSQQQVLRLLHTTQKRAASSPRSALTDALPSLLQHMQVNALQAAVESWSATVHSS